MGTFVRFTVDLTLILTTLLLIEFVLVFCMGTVVNMVAFEAELPSSRNDVTAAFRTGIIVNIILAIGILITGGKKFLAP